MIDLIKFGHQYLDMKLGRKPLANVFFGECGREEKKF
jgi:hypothetical protein